MPFSVSTVVVRPSARSDDVESWRDDRRPFSPFHVSPRTFAAACHLRQALLSGGSAIPLNRAPELDPSSQVGTKGRAGVLPALSSAYAPATVEITYISRPPASRAHSGLLEALETVSAEPLLGSGPACVG